jgi:hypothetical protein
MKEVELVIKISEEIYKRILPYKDLPIISNLANDFPEIIHAIANGVPIPKGHGKIGDLDKLKANIEAYRDIYDHNGDDYEFGKYTAYDMSIDAIDEAPTIIEVDRSEEDG